jgi:pyruvate kinase
MGKYSRKKIIRKTKIICTIGPSTNSEEMMASLLRSGMDIARINFSHGSLREHARDIRRLKAAARNINSPLAILQDLPGPKDRTGKVKDGLVQLNDGAILTLTTKQVLGDNKRISISWHDLPKHVTLHDAIWLGDGDIKLEVIGIAANDVKCRILNGGMLSDNKGITIPGTVWDVDSVTSDDFHYLEFGIKHNVDFAAVSFVRKAEDISRVKKFLRNRNSSIKVIAKIERPEALEALDAILEEADGVMVARGDLGVSVPIQKVPVIQKSIIQKCNALGKPVIVATQMLESMVDSPQPTRAEATDVANAIFDGTDAIMLSEETAIGKFPLETVTMMSEIALEAEAAQPYEDILNKKGRDLRPQTDDAISYDACHTARQLNAVAIIAFTSSGSTARRVSKYRPNVPIIAMTTSDSTRRQLSLSWGVNSYKVPRASGIMNLFKQGAHIVKECGIAKRGDLVIITGGIPVGIPGSTNLLKVEHV